MTKILVDTSVWIEHFRKANSALVDLLYADKICTHAFIIGEIACGTMKKRDEILSHMKSLTCLLSISDSEILQFIDQRSLNGKGIGLVDIHLLATSLVSNVKLWTLDRSFMTQAERLNLNYQV